jgi:hypothetical protein
MKKTLTIIAIIFFIVASIIYINRYNISENIIKTISIQMDREKNRQVGKDSVFVWQNGTFQIGHYASGNHLEFHEDGIIKTILKDVNTYKEKDSKFYVITREGYAVIDKKNIAKIFVVIPESEYINGYSINENGEKESYSRHIEHTNIQYIVSFNKFSEEEQKVLNKLIN